MGWLLYIMNGSGCDGDGMAGHNGKDFWFIVN